MSQSTPEFNQKDFVDKRVDKFLKLKILTFEYNANTYSSA